MKHFKSVVYEQTLKYNALPFPKVQIKSSEHAYQYALDILKHEVLECKEYFYAIYLNRANNTVSFAKISEGGISGTVVDVRLIMKHAIDSLASGIILVHNHPSCNVMPSAADNHVTNNIKQAAKLFDINVLDHIIIGNRNGDYFSYADEGNLN